MLVSWRWTTAQLSVAGWREVNCRFVLQSPSTATPSSFASTVTTVPTKRALRFITKLWMTVSMVLAGAMVKVSLHWRRCDSDNSQRDTSQEPFHFPVIIPGYSDCTELRVYWHLFCCKLLSGVSVYTCCLSVTFARLPMRAARAPWPFVCNVCRRAHEPC